MLFNQVTMWPVMENEGSVGLFHPEVQKLAPLNPQPIAWKLSAFSLATYVILKFLSAHK